MITTNYHTHTVYCDGADTPEALVEAAIAQGFTALGFSEHSFVSFDPQGSMSAESENEYHRRVNALKKQYADRIKVYCGLEQDYFSETPACCYDYIIGSVHYVCKNGIYLPVDYSAQAQVNAVEEHYGGDFDAFAEDYFSLVRNLVTKTNADVIGHFDLVLKYCEQLDIRPGERFFAAAEQAVAELCKTGAIFEINTGAIARGYRSAPYPLPEILRMIRKHGGRILFSSDCHDKRFLRCWFEEAEQLAMQTGFTEHYIITRDGFCAVPIC